ncbi:C1 family peptidase [Archangium gephyra]|nr:C1 family peptidase [Archangium gephyra]
MQSAGWHRRSSWIVLASIFMGVLGCEPPEPGEPPSTPVLVHQFLRQGNATFVERSDGVRTPTVDVSYFRPAPEALAGSTPVTEAGFGTLAAPTSYSLAAWQTPIRNQADRGTCGVFSSAAAIEARYRRDYGISVDLSEQYLMHIVKSTSLDYPRTYQYENQSSYWYGAGSHSLSLTLSYALPLESEVPYRNQAGMDAVRRSIPAAGELIWSGDPAQNPTTQAQIDAFEYSPLYIPLSARNNARYGVSSYTLLDWAQARDTALIENYISSNREVAIDVSLNWRYNSTTGIHEYDSTVNGGGHSMLIIGYDRSQQYFLLKNSWGGSEYVKVSYQFIQNASHGAAVVNGVRDPNSPVRKGQWLGTWDMNHDGWAGKLMVRRIPHPANAATRLGSYYSGSTGRNVNGYLVDDNRGIYFRVADTTSDTAPGTMTGQLFQMYIHGWDPQDASGYAWDAGNTRYGSVLKRSGLSIPYGNSFTASRWMGTWYMNHDGWRGQLQLTSYSTSGSLWGTYTPDGGTPVSVTGTFDTARPTTATFVVHNSGGAQYFYVHHFGWSQSFFAGWTYWNGYPYGVQGTK